MTADLTSSASAKRRGVEDYINCKSYAKVNISLDILNKRKDGYHTLRTVMQQISLCDLIKVTKKDEGITLTCSLDYIPCDQRNIAYKAATAFFEFTGQNGGARIEIKKYIPIGAGLGGGSSNGAVVINALDKLYNTRLSKADKTRIGVGVGADIPFFFYGGTALCEGIGELITPIQDIPFCRIVLVKPRISLSTARVFNTNKIDMSTDYTSATISAINSGDITALCNSCGNGLESAALSIAPIISKIKQTITELGAKAALMTGSGSAVFGIFTNNKSAVFAYNELSAHFKQTFISRPINANENIF